MEILCSFLKIDIPQEHMLKGKIWREHRKGDYEILL
jgi:hypothetical protein